MAAPGAKVWYFPDGDRPPTGPADLPEAHESMMVLNTTDELATVKLDLFWEDRRPDIGLRFEVEGERVRCLRVPWTDDTGRMPDVPVRTQYAIRVRSDQPVVCQYGRAETVPTYTLYTTMGWTPAVGPTPL
jgi:hypothetical protein